MAQFSTYFDNLNDQSAKERYKSKILVIDNVDPYVLKANACIRVNPSEIETFQYLPPTSFPDIYLYLVEGISPFTKEQFKNYKSMYAYNLFVCGFVRDLLVKKFVNKMLVLATVMHSQRLRETPLKPWVIINENGNIISAHCTCMAGLAESCTHVAALLFYIEYAVRYREMKTVTGVAAYWSVPVTKQPSYSEISKMNLKSALGKKPQLDTILEEPKGNKSKKSCVLKQKTVPPITNDEHAELENELFQLGLKCSYFSIHRKYQESYIPKCISVGYPIVLTELFEEAKCGLTFNILLDECEKINVEFTKEQAERVKRETKNQALSKSWHRFRAGCITASNLKKACHSDPAMPSASLIALICYPNTKIFETNATKWGITHEETMRKIYIEEMKSKHQNFQLQNVGLVLNPAYPYLGASPDGIVHCDCCGTGVLEIKCPYVMRYKRCSNFDSKYCLETSKSGKLQLKRNHEYFYQVQAQLFLTESSFADFCVWTTVDFHIERIFQDREFWSDAKAKALNFFKLAVLPELLAKFFTRSSNAPPVNESSKDYVIPEPKMKNSAMVGPKAKTNSVKQDSGSTRILKPKIRTKYDSSPIVTTSIITGASTNTKPVSISNVGKKTVSDVPQASVSASTTNIATSLPKPKVTSTRLPKPKVIATSLPKSNVTATNLPKPNVTATNLPKPNVPATNLPKPNVPATNLPKPNVPATNLPKAQLPCNKLAKTQRHCNKLAKAQRPCNKLAKTQRPCNKLAKTQRPCNKLAKTQCPCNKLAKTQRPCNKLAKTQRPCNKLAKIQRHRKKLAKTQHS